MQSWIWLWHAAMDTVEAVLLTTVSTALGLGSGVAAGTGGGDQGGCAASDAGQPAVPGRVSGGFTGFPFAFELVDQPLEMADLLAQGAPAGGGEPDPGPGAPPRVALLHPDQASVF